MFCDVGGDLVVDVGWNEMFLDVGNGDKCVVVVVIVVCYSLVGFCLIEIVGCLVFH